METTKSDNELIEEFYVSQGGKPHMKEDISFYESSWDMLMPVVEKIEAIPDLSLKISVTSGYVEIAGLPPCNQKIFKNCSHEGSKMKACYLAVVEFIKWYSQQK